MPGDINKVHKVENGDFCKVSERSFKAIETAYESLFNYNDKTKKLLKDTDVYIFDNFSNCQSNSVEMNINVARNKDRAVGFINIGGNKDIALNERKLLSGSIYNYLTRNSKKTYQKMRSVLFHEIGHLFDYQVGESAAYRKISELNKKLPNTEALKEMRQRVQDEYVFSDSIDYDKALLKDLKSIEADKEKREYLEEQYFCTYDIDYMFDEKIGNFGIKEVDASKSSKSEIIAQLFACLFIPELEDNQKFLEMFPNTQKLLAKDIETELGVDINKFNRTKPKV